MERRRWEVARSARRGRGRGGGRERAWAGGGSPTGRIVAGRAVAARRARDRGHDPGPPSGPAGARRAAVRPAGRAAAPPRRSEPRASLWPGPSRGAPAPDRRREQDRGARAASCLLRATASRRDPRRSRSAARGSRSSPPREGQAAPIGRPDRVRGRRATPARLGPACPRGGGAGRDPRHLPLGLHRPDVGSAFGPSAREAALVPEPERHRAAPEERAPTGAGGRVRRGHPAVPRPSGAGRPHAARPAGPVAVEPSARGPAAAPSRAGRAPWPLHRLAPGGPGRFRHRRPAPPNLSAPARPTRLQDPPASSGRPRGRGGIQHRPAPEDAAVATGAGGRGRLREPPRLEPNAASSAIDAAPGSGSRPRTEAAAARSRDGSGDGAR